MRKKYFYGLSMMMLFTIILTHCKTSESEFKQSFLLQYSNDSTIKDLSIFQLNRICSVKNNVILVCEKFIKGQKESETCVRYKKVADSIFETKIISDFDKTPLDTINVLSYCNKVKDTSFLYFYDVQKYPPTQPLGSDDYFHILRKINDNLFASYKENNVDSTFSELQFYDKNFKVLKIIKVIKGKYYEFVNSDIKLDEKFALCFYKEYFGKFKITKKIAHQPPNLGL